MKDEKKGVAYLMPKLILSLFSLFYTAVIKIWNFCYDNGIFKIHKVDSKVISIGNITLGGTGKTPFTMFLADLLKKQGKKVAVLIRGYGDDEWDMMGKANPSVPVIKGRDRVKSAREAREMYNAEILILDDGFQHRRIKRDLDIVLIDAHEAFANGHIFPRGTLREPVSAARRADIIVLTKADFGKDNIKNLRITLSGDLKKHKTLEAVYKPVCFFNNSNEKRFDLDIIRNKKICVLSAIADSSYFKYMLKDLGAELSCEIDYLDHHNYTEKDLDYVQKKAKASGCEFIVTTEKDIVKLETLHITHYTLHILVLHIELEIVKGMEELNARLDSVYSG